MTRGNESKFKYISLLFTALLMFGLISQFRPVAAQDDSQFFPPTNHTVRGKFLEYWRAQGGLAIFGYPLTDEILEVNPADQKTYTVQWFERNRFEYHPEFKGTVYEVLLGLLGNQVTIGRGNEGAFRYFSDPKIPGQYYFPQTGHTLRNSFKQFWDTRGGLPIFGYPTSEEFYEVNPDDGKTYVVQYFERNRFEYHPEFKGTEYEVLLGLLGNQLTGGAFYPDPPPNNVPSKLLVPDKYRTTPFQTERTLNLPAGFKISVFAAGMTDPRMMALSPNGDIFFTERYPGNVKVLTDNNHDGIADNIYTFAEGLAPYPHGVAFYGGYLYVALETKVIRYPYQSGDLKARANYETIINDLPSGQAGVLNGHQTRTITFGPDNKLYVSIGSSCDVCIETNKYRASVWQFNPDGSGGRLYAGGLRNAVGIAFDPKTNLLWATVNGRNGLGDNLPPEQLTPIRDGGNYGWPYCVGNNPPTPDPDFGTGKADFCQNTVDRSLIALPAHSSPLGLAFYNASHFPEVYRTGLFVVQHGSFPGERSSVYGDGIRFVSTRPGKMQQGVKDFATGWINSAKDGYWGRVVAPMVGADGALYITDDIAGAIYRVSYGG